MNFANNLYYKKCAGSIVVRVGSRRIVEGQRSLVRVTRTVGAPELGDGRNKGDDNNTGNNQRKIVLNNGKVAKEETTIEKNDNPGDAAGNVIESKKIVGHAADAGDERREGADDGNEAGEKDGFGAIAFVKAVSAFQIVAAEKAGVFVFEDTQAEEVAEPVVGGVT